MNPKSIFIAIGVMFFMTLVLLLISAKQTKNSKANNWNWSNNWNSSASAALPPQVNPTPVPPVVPLSTQPPKEIVVTTYAEAVEASAKSGKKIVLFFSSQSCPWCIKMKNQTLPHAQVKKALDSYIFLVIDTDDDKETTKKFKIRGIPAYVITDKTEQAIKFGNGFKTPEEFISWLS